MSRFLVITLIGFSLALPAQAAPNPACPPGFAALQNSDACVRVSGRVRSDTLIGSSRTRSVNGVETRTSGRIQLDVRKQTEYGPLRAVIRAEGVR